VVESIRHFLMPQLAAFEKTLGFVKELELQPLGRIADFAILT
jgi:hypothetical protein